MLHPTYPIATDRLLLRPYVLNDLEDFYETLRIPEVVRYLYWEIKNRDEAATLLARRTTCDAIRAVGDWLVLAVILKETGALLGDVVLKWESAEHRQGEIGFVLNPAYHGNTESVGHSSCSPPRGRVVASRLEPASDPQVVRGL